MGGMLLQAIRGPAGRGRTAVGQQEDPSGGRGVSNDTQSGFDQEAALKYTQDRWNDLKNAYIVYH